MPIESVASFVPLGLPEPMPDWPTCVAITSKDDLEAYYSENHERLGLDYGSEGTRFSDVIEQYEDSYFAKKALLIVLFGEGDGSTTHSLESVAVEADKLIITIRRHSPEIVMTVLAQWAGVLEIDAQYAKLPANISFVT